MTNKCVSCKKIYPYKYWLMFRKWCKKCRIYQCEFCLEKNLSCKRCGTKTTNHVIKIIPISLIIIILCMIFIPFNNMWNEIYYMKTTKIDDIKIGDTVKVEGYINSTKDVVISAKYVPAGEGYTVEYTPTDFYLENDGKVIFIDTSYNDIKIESGSQMYGAYWNDDRVCVYGKVYQNEDGTKAIKAEIIAKDSKDFYKPYISQEIILAIIFGSITAIIVSIIILVYRNRLHSLYLKKNDVILK